MAPLKVESVQKIFRFEQPVVMKFSDSQ